MEISLELSGKRWNVQHNQACSIAIPLRFVRSKHNEPEAAVVGDAGVGVRQPVHFDAPPAFAEPYRCGGFVGQMAAGGTCNVERLEMIPHCNGTHTETRRHITDDGLNVTDMLVAQGAFVVPASLISISPVSALDTQESYVPALVSGDWVITCAALRAACDEIDESFMQAVIIRTLPNDTDKKTRYYSAQNDSVKSVPPFLTLDAARYLVERGVQHVLVDMPSVDRYYDEGKLSVHHLLLSADRESATVTELIYVPNELADGPYLLNLHCPSFDTDAVPSRPVLIPLVALSNSK